MPKPNILIILADDIGVDGFRIDKLAATVKAHVTGPTPDHTGGPVPLPTFERMLRSGVHFEHAWAHPVCTPTRASLWTGMQPWKTSLGYPLGGDLLPNNRNLKSLAQALKAGGAGYRCAMFGKWDLGGVRDPADPAKDQNPVKTWGWDHFAGIYRGGLRGDGTRDYKFSTQDRVGWDRLNGTDGNPAPEILTKRQAAAAALRQRYSEEFLRNNPDLRFYIWEKDVIDPDQRTAVKRQAPAERQFLYATEDQVEDAKAWLAENRTAGPWCIALNLITPHDPLHVPPPGTYSASTIKDPSKPKIQELLVAMLESMDHYVGKLLAAIADQLENTVILFVGDNGTQDRDIDTKESVDEVEGDDKSTEMIGGVHVPMIVADGGVMAGKPPCFVANPRRSVGSPVHIIDIYATVLDIARVTKPANDSTSMVPHLSGAAGAKRTHNFSQMYAPARLRPGYTDKYECPGTSASASDGTYKLTCRVLRKEFPKPDNDFLYLVDLAGNPSATAHFEYMFSRLVPDPAIPGAFVEKTIDAITRNTDGTFTIGDLAYQGKILELYAVLARERPNADLNASFPIIRKSSFEFPATLLDKPVLIENLETKRYLFSDGPAISGNRGAEGGWLASSGFQSPNVVGADANYYNRALWIIRKQGDAFLIENLETKRYLFSDGSELSRSRGGEGGWLASSGFQSPKLVGADANYYNRALWVVQPQGSAFLLANLETKRYAFSDGPSFTGNRGAEGGWLASSGFQSPNAVGADANYYNRALWLIKRP